MRILLPFFDDSTLIFAKKIGAKLSSRGNEIIYCLGYESENSLSDRQVDLLLGDQPYRTTENVKAYAETENVDAVVSAKAFLSLRLALASPSYRARRDRPCCVAFQPGLEFTPNKGFANRRDHDVVFLNNTTQRGQFLEYHRPEEWQHVAFGHPYFETPDFWRQIGSSGDVVFFAQAICPPTLKARLHILQIVNAIAKANPERRVLIKLRHLPGENSAHSHKERFPYPTLAEEFLSNRASNLDFIAGTMDEALANAAFAITCTSTAAMDAISAGVPTAVYTEYVEYYLDKFSDAMDNEFLTSGIITSLQDLLELNFAKPSPGWVASHFRGDSLYDELETAIMAFPTRSEVKLTGLQYAG